MEVAPLRLTVVEAFLYLASIPATLPGSLSAVLPLSSRTTILYIEFATTASLY